MEKEEQGGEMGRRKLRLAPINFCTLLEPTAAPTQKTPTTPHRDMLGETPAECQMWR